jgi:hypothetical protein
MENGVIMPEVGHAEGRVLDNLTLRCLDHGVDGGCGRPAPMISWPSRSRSLSFGTSLNGDENANEDFDYYWYVACCCLHKPDGDGRRAQPPEGDPRSSSGSSTASRRHSSAAGRSRNVRADGCRQQIM